MSENHPIPLTPEANQTITTTTDDEILINVEPEDVISPSNSPSFIPSSTGGIEEMDTDSSFSSIKMRHKRDWKSFIYQSLLGRPGEHSINDARHIYLKDNSYIRNERDWQFPPNVQRNQKYSIISFIPLVLYHQFKYFYNLYFLIICISQFFEILRVNDILTTMTPLILVLFFTMCKECSDDYQRYRRDCEANSQQYERISREPLTGKVVVENIPSRMIRVGDLVQVYKDQRLPADMILIRTTDKQGSIFLRTDQLDGEIDWKMRSSIPSTQKSTSLAEILSSGSSLTAAPPSKDIHSFLGNFTHRDEGIEVTDSLSIDNTMWMNTVIASGGSHIGLVIYTGKQCRASMNTSTSRTKMGLTDHEINRLSKVLCFVVVLISLIMTAFHGFHGSWIIVMIRYMVLFSSIIPISMRFNLDISKTVYSAGIERDLDIPGVIVRCGTLPEELGRVQFLLTDKTGTLTCNDMELKRITLENGMETITYGLESVDEINEHIFNHYTNSLSKGLGSTTTATGSRSPSLRGSANLSQRLWEIVEALALCHNVTPVIDDNSLPSYQASSPDEVAIVRWTERVGLTLEERSRDHIVLKLEKIGYSDDKFSSPNGKDVPSTPRNTILLKYKILHIFPFTSETKRMGIIVKPEWYEGSALFLSKGADSIMLNLVMENEWAEEACQMTALPGLRTLVLGSRKLSSSQLKLFEDAFHNARISLVDRYELCRNAIEKYLEEDIVPLAVTGVEDRLQSGVRECLEKIRNAGIKTWMLTGDKVETATNIAISTRLFPRDSRIIIAQNVEGDEESVINWISMLERSVKASEASATPLCLVVDGSSLQNLMSIRKEKFALIAMWLPAVVCCRCSPTQKADVCRMIQEIGGKRVCCIGDGGNDVSMIQAADIGIGIVGKEGRQASLAADVSILEFSHLLKLLIWHGRNSYKRTSKLVLFIIQRGTIISTMQAVFSAMIYFQPFALFRNLLAIGYTTVYTMAPVFSFVLDKDVSVEVAMQFEDLYRDLLKGRELNYKTFFKTMLISVYQGGIIMLGAIYIFEADLIHIVGISFSALILNELLMIALEIVTWHYIMVVAEIGSLLAYVVSIRLLEGEFDLRFTQTFTFLWKVLLITICSFLPLYVYFIAKRFLSPTSARKLSSSNRY